MSHGLRGVTIGIALSVVLARPVRSHLTSVGSSTGEQSHLELEMSGPCRAGLGLWAEGPLAMTSLRHWACAALAGPGTPLYKSI